jgi:hypothetical protein
MQFNSSYYNKIVLTYESSRDGFIQHIKFINDHITEIDDCYDYELIEFFDKRYMYPTNTFIFRNFIIIPEKNSYGILYKITIKCFYNNEIIHHINTI